jgi:HK97 family phage major capsid protein
MSMTVAEARSEIKNLFNQADLIEKKYPDGLITNGEDEREVKRLLTEIDSLEGKLSGLEDAEARRKRILDGMDRYSKAAPGAMRPGTQAGETASEQNMSPGDQFIASQEYRQLKLSGTFNSNLARVNFAVTLRDGTSLVDWGKKASKTLLYGSSATSGGPFVQNDVQPGYVDIRQRELTLLDLIPRVTTDSDTIEYVYETTFTNNAATVAEATVTTGTSGKKAESALAYATATVPVETIAHWLPVTNRMLSDAPAIRGIINGRLLLGLDLTLESQILSANGTPPNLSGITDHAINAVGMGTDNAVDALFKGRTLVRTTGHGRPNAYVIAPADWQDIRLSRENAATGTLGNYLMGPPSAVGATTLWGIPVVESEALSAGTALVADFVMGCTLFDREQAAVRVGTIDDQFVRNMQTILAELRAAFVVWRPTMFTQVTGI